MKKLFLIFGLFLWAGLSNAASPIIVKDTRAGAWPADTVAVTTVTVGASGFSINGVDALTTVTRVASAEEADVCTTATFAVLAGTAQAANTATTATYATGAGTAYLAYNSDNATTASYAATAGTAAHATSADNATTATHATTSTYATTAGAASTALNATTSTYATYAGSADTATTATRATTSTYATAAGSATSAATANTCTTATYSTNSNAAVSAQTATTSTYATTAATATTATIAVGYGKLANGATTQTWTGLNDYLTTPTVGGVYLGTGSGTGGATALSALTDVSLTSQTTGQGVGWNGSTWTNMTLAGETGAKGDTGATGPAGVPLPDYTGKAKWFLKVADDETTVTWTNELYTSTTVRTGPTASFTDFPLAKSIFSAGDTGHTYSGPVGVVGEAAAPSGDTATGVGGIASTNGINQGRGVSGVGKVQATGDTGASIGIYGCAEDTHAGGRNIGLYGAAVNGATNYALWMSTGNIYSAAAQTWTLASSINALNVQSGLFNIDTTNNRVGINNAAPAYAMDVTGDINCTGSVRVNGTALGSGGGGSTTVYATTGTLANGASITVTHAADAMPYYKRTAQMFSAVLAESLLLHMDGTNGATTFTDETGKTVTRSVATVSTTQSKFGGASAYLSTNAAYLSLVGTTGVSNIGTGDFTIDFWMYPTSVNTNNYVVYQGSGSPNLVISFTSSAMTLLGAGGATVASGACTITANNWYHVAATGSGTTRKLFLNGTSVATATNSTSIGDATNALKIGDFGASYGMVGYVDEFRIIKGSAVWTDAFTPPTAAYGLTHNSYTQVVNLTSSYVTIAYPTSTTTTFTNSTGAAINYLALVQLLP